MSHEIRRYESYDAWPADEYEGRYVLFEDHLAVVATVREDEAVKRRADLIWQDGYDIALRDAVEAVKDAAIWRATDQAVQVAGTDVRYVVREDAVAAIEALGGERNGGSDPCETADQKQNKHINL